LANKSYVEQNRFKNVFKKDVKNSSIYETNVNFKLSVNKLFIFKNFDWNFFPVLLKLVKFGFIIMMPIVKEIYVFHKPFEIVLVQR
jgi:hypothetical protein